MNKNIKKTIIATMIIVSGFNMVGCSAQTEKTTTTTSNEGWTPERDIEVAVSASTGGGADLWARTITNTISTNGLSDVAWTVNNYAGGGSAIGYNYVMNKSGDDYTMLSLAIGGCLSSHMSEWDQSWEEMIEPVCILALDNATLCVSANGPYKTIEELIQAGIDNPGTIRYGSENRNNASHYGFELIKKYTGADMNYIQFDSSGEAATALLGGHVDCAVLNPGECAGQIESGDFIPVAIFSAERLGGLFEDTPTFSEVGYPEIVYSEFRGLAVPVNTKSETKEYYAEIGRQLMDTPEMKTYFEQNYLTPGYMDSDDAYDYVKEIVDSMVETFRSL